MTTNIPIEVDSIVMEASSFEDQSFMRKMSKHDVNQINATLVQKLYESVLQFQHCDFGDISKSKGDISKVTGIDQTMECLDDLMKIHEANGIPTQDIVEIKTMISTVTRLRRGFEFGFKTNTDYLIILYNTIVMAIMDATSMLIANYTTYMVTPNEINYSSVTAKSGKHRGTIAIDSIRRFNSMASDGSLDSIVNTIVTNVSKPAGTRKNEETGATESLTAAAAITAAKAAPLAVKVLLGVAAGAGVTALTIFSFRKLTIALRELVYYYYCSKVKLSDFLETQAAFLESNRLVVQSSNRPASQKMSILQKQEKVILKLRRLADKIKINAEDAEEKSKKKLAKDNSAFTLSEMEKQAASNALNGSSIQII